MNIGNQIRRHRENRGWSQEQLAKHVLVTRQTISHWETGRSYPDAQSLLLLSRLFGTSVDALMEGDAELMRAAVARNRRYRSARKGTVLLGLAGSATLAAPLVDSLGPLAGALAALIPTAVALVGSYSASRAETTGRDLETYRDVLSLPSRLVIECPAHSANEPSRIVDEAGNEMYRLVRRGGPLLAASAWRMRYWRLVSSRGRRVATVNDRTLGGPYPAAAIDARTMGTRLALRRDARLADDGLESAWRIDSERVAVDGSIFDPEFGIGIEGAVIARVAEAVPAASGKDGAGQRPARRYLLSIEDGTFAETALTVAVSIAMARARELDGAFEVRHDPDPAARPHHIPR